MKKLINIWFLGICCLLMTSCEDEIDVDLEDRPNQLVVDAFITNDSSTQTIRLTSSAPYFLNAPTLGVTGQSVKIKGPNGKEFVFQDQGNGNYNYDPATNGALDSVGFKYNLELAYNGRIYTATSILNPVPPIDSLTYEFREAELGSEEGYYVQFWAQDFFGRKDYYWIKSYKNGTNINVNQPSSIILSEDAAFGGEGADGFIFILPIRFAVTNDDEPFAAGDICKVELLSMNLDAYDYIDQVTIQANNGGLFSTPPANIRSTIKDANGNLQEEVLGVFSLSSISEASIQILP